MSQNAFQITFGGAFWLVYSGILKNSLKNTEVRLVLAGFLFI